MRERRNLTITAFPRAEDYASHFRELYGPTIAARKAATAAGRDAEFDEALDALSREWNRGAPDAARFEQEYLLAVGTRV